MPLTTTNRPSIAKTSPSPAEPAGVSVVTELVLCGWFVLVVVAFWGPYLSVLHPEITTPLYGLFLLGGTAMTALRLLRRREAARQKTADTAPTAERKPRRGN